jgi:hypothetical protein
MKSEPKCKKRGCVYFVGVRRRSPEDESTEIVCCDVFPEGIPDEIAYGDNPHTKPFLGDGGVTFKSKEKI